MELQKRSLEYEYALDILTDGSEFTGHGTIFLTVSRRTAMAPLSTESTPMDMSNTILARYAISGLSSMTARLCADQKLSLSKVRAVLCPTHSCSIGLASLLLGLSSAGQEKVAVIGGSGVGSYAETVASNVLRNRAYPNVATCEVPHYNAHETNQICRQWWKVYEDEFVRIHGTTVVIATTNSDDDHRHGHRDDEKGDSVHLNDNGSTIVYIYTLLRSLGGEEATPLYSFCVLPPGYTASSCVLRPLPLELKQRHPFRFVVCLDTGSSPQPVLRVQSLTNHAFFTSPRHQEWDTGLLIRAASQAQLLHNSIDFCFPVMYCAAKPNPTLPSSPQQGRAHLESDDIETQRLESCSSLLLRYVHSLPCMNPCSGPNTNNDATSPFAIVSRKTQIWEKCRKRVGETPTTSEPETCGATSQADLEQKINISPDTLNQLRAVYSGSRKLVDTAVRNYKPSRDDNEIDLDTCEEDKEYNPVGSPIPVVDDNEICLNEDDEASLPGRVAALQGNTMVDKCSGGEVNGSTNGGGESVSTFDAASPHLLVLGTGCASPSPLRGASGYALLLPTWVAPADNCSSALSNSNPQSLLAAIIECGEGTLTTLFRHLPKCGDKAYHQSERLRQIKFIWISHAHLDHYGGLPCLIRAIQNAGGRRSYCICQNHNGSAGKRKLNQDRIPTSCCCNLPPVVIAPTKVLNYLDASLRSTSGKIPTSKQYDGAYPRRENHTRLFHGVTHRDFELSPFATEVRDIIFQYTMFRQSSKENGFGSIELEQYRPFVLLRSVPVEHCPQAHGLVLGLNICVSPMDHLSPGQRCEGLSPFLLCFSGDTRPSPNLVQACRGICSEFNSITRISLLIHESTFDDEERGRREARKKRHSTVLEALDIAKQIHAEATLLTHFSQRYPHVPPGSLLTENLPVDVKDDQEGSFRLASFESGYQMNFCFASDGLMFPLTKKALSLFGSLNTCTLNALKMNAALKHKSER